MRKLINASSSNLAALQGATAVQGLRCLLHSLNASQLPSSISPPKVPAKAMMVRHRRRC